MFRPIAMAVALSLAIVGVQASLVDRGGGLIYADVLRITWLFGGALGVVGLMRRRP